MSWEIFSDTESYSGLLEFEKLVIYFEKNRVFKMLKLVIVNFLHSFYFNYNQYLTKYNPNSKAYFFLQDSNLIYDLKCYDYVANCLITVVN
ncbi:hypothetical protein COBT_003479 [Conglomerata obtusa]